jgi:signal transduction histidine kinase
MKGGVRAFCPARAFATWAIAALLLAIGAPAAADTAVRLESAQWRTEPNGTFVQPVRPPAFASDRWEAVKLPHAQQRQVMPAARAGDIVTSWYRVEVPAEAAAASPLRLYVPRWQTIGQIAVYADDRLAFRSGAGPIWNGFNHPLWVDLEASSGTRPAIVLIRIDHLQSAGAALSTVWIGDDAGLAWRRTLREWGQAGLPYLASAAFLVIGLFALGVWLFRREAVYGLFFLSSVLFYVRCMHYYLGLEPLPISEAWFGWLTVQSLSWLVVTVYAFGFRLHGLKYRKVEWTLIGVVLAASLVSLPPLAVVPELSLIAPLAYLLMVFATIVLTGLAIWSARRARSPEAMGIALWNGLNIPAGVFDLLLQNQRIDIELPYLLPYTSIGLFVAFMLVVRKRYVGALRDSESAQANLEARLRAREAELGETHARLRAVEKDQVLSAERQRLMQDMHDGLGSSLMGALKVVETGGQPAVAQLLRECLDDLKLAIDSLEPVQADLLLLLATLRFRLGNRLEQAGVKLHWQVEDVPVLPWLDPTSALHVLRIIQEIFSNMIKHSGATEVRLTTRHAGNAVLVSIHDNGSGFDPTASGGRGRGLANVQRRAAAIGATTRWRTTDAGTSFELELPVERPPGVAAAAPIDSPAST